MERSLSGSMDLPGGAPGFGQLRLCWKQAQDRRVAGWGRRAQSPSVSAGFVWVALGEQQYQTGPKGNRRKGREWLSILSLDLPSLGILWILWMTKVPGLFSSGKLHGSAAYAIKRMQMSEFFLQRICWTVGRWRQESILPGQTGS